jgi:hypothetical protein
LIAPWEEYFLNEINDLPMEKDQAPEINQEMKQKVCLALFYSFSPYFNSLNVSLYDHLVMRC